MTAYNMIAEADSDDECRLWVRKLINARDDVVAFVDSRLDGQGTGKYLGFFKGSFNFSFHIGFGEGKPSVLIRVAKPGHTFTAWRDEKVKNEVRVIEYLREHTTIPLPRVRCWGLTDERPAQLGPFIIMDFIEGVRLSTFLKEPSEDDQADPILNPAIEEATLETIYDQLADYILQISQLEFSSIGAISKDVSSGTWSVTGRPLTFNMNELATNTGYPADQFPNAPLIHASDYFHALADHHLLHLRTQRNLSPSNGAADVQRRFIARHHFRQLIPKYCTTTTGSSVGPFTLFRDDLQPANMLLNPTTLRITALLDFEFAYSAPAHFTHDPPWWLLLRGPDLWLDKHGGLDQFLERYVPRMGQFLRALEQVERKGEVEGEGGVGEDGFVVATAMGVRGGCGRRLSARMRESWETGRFWFDYAARTSLDIDDVYWAALHDYGADGDGFEGLDAATRAEMEELVTLKMEQRRAYNEAYDISFPDDESD
ncbi:hypothetical protein CHGG_03020 [Chaetomium globosum CBS 148.51]|uniref:Aminoglycoside phosphotransferase domain-containing protein n=1 Tax=Chaetomium globosum (strain ATCC 6205 / CBS 148.51 / DSM 1962 / NBRC 6347 / NRRL 1970) TaxID=306901 RepID=Q2H9T4_CHAGB|nr:uncharacterized protein CHGG_03020 [Chaetomium globosum CBS 148.51]EAQ91085.1 hypothetical protein CHGG_03020 [Chaetomium globosum CBS 148.51]